MSTTVSSETEAIIEEYIQDERLRGLTDETLRTYRTNLMYTFDYLECSPDEVGKSELKDLLDHLKNEKQGRHGPGVKMQTVNVYFSALSSLFNFLTYEGDLNANPIPGFRERYLTKQDDDSEDRQLISVDEMAGLILSVMSTRDKAVMLVLAKTGIRRGELVSLDIDDVDISDKQMRIPPTPKRSNQVVFFDAECARVLESWLEIRARASPETDALFLNQENERLQRNGVYNLVTKHAAQVGLHDSDSADLQDKFTPHCFRHWFTTHLRRSGMDREFRKELRGDTRDVDAMDTYDHVERQELRESYLAHIPQLNI